MSDLFQADGTVLRVYQEQTWFRHLIVSPCVDDGEPGVLIEVAEADKPSRSIFLPDYCVRDLLAMLQLVRV